MKIPIMLSYHKLVEARTPKWTYKPAIKEIYEAAKDLRNNGYDVVVDHIVPIRSERVCGLHCEDNLMIVHRLENQKKSNIYWPDMWNEQIELKL